jgi:hypothetical protein
MTMELPPRASLLGLPQELQDQIVSHFEANYYRRDVRLLKLSLTCKSLRATCLPFIFGHLCLHPYPRDGPPGPTRESVLLHSLSSYAHLGRYIHVLEAKGLLPLDKTAEHLLEYTTRLKSLNYHYDVKYHKERPLLYIDAPRLVRALKHVSSTLTALTISYLFGFSSGSLPDPRPIRTPAHAHAACSFRHFEALESLSIPISVLLGWDYEHAPDLADLLPQTLLHLNFESDVWWFFEDHPNMTPITTVVKSYVEKKRWKEATPRLETVSGHFALSSNTSEVQSADTKIEYLQMHCKALTILLEENDLRYGRNVREMLEGHGLSHFKEADPILEKAGLSYPPPPQGTLVDFME